MVSPNALPHTHTHTPHTAHNIITNDSGKADIAVGKHIWTTASQINLIG